MCCAATTWPRARARRAASCAPAQAPGDEPVVLAPSRRRPAAPWPTGAVRAAGALAAMMPAVAAGFAVAWCAVWCWSPAGGAGAAGRRRRRGAGRLPARGAGGARGGDGPTGRAVGWHRGRVIRDPAPGSLLPPHHRGSPAPGLGCPRRFPAGARHHRAGTPPAAERRRRPRPGWPLMPGPWGCPVRRLGRARRRSAGR